MAINTAGANVYFDPENHTMSNVWASFRTEQKTAAIAQSKRILARALRRELDESESAITWDVREDLACYEQALYLLRNSPAVVEGTDGIQGFMANDQANPDQPSRMDPGLIAPEARRWLTRARENGMPAGMVEMSRG